jgi:hypothetical protein
MTEKKKKEETALVPVTERFDALRVNPDELKEVVDANFGTRTASVFDLERIKVGTGGATAYTVTDELDGEDVVKEFEAMIAFWKDARSYWAQPLDESGGGAPPDCSSEDMVTGYGTFEDGSTCRKCESCPYNQWESDPKGGRGKACKEMIIMFLLRTGREERIFPSMLVAPPSSISNISGYMMGLTSRGLPYYGVTHRFTLEGDTNAAGIRYCKVKLLPGRDLTSEERKSLRAYGALMRPTFEKVKITKDLAETPVDPEG